MSPMPKQTVCQFIAPRQLLPWIVLLLYMALRIVWPTVVFSLKLHEWLQPLARLTGWLINATMLSYLWSFFVLWLILVCWGKLSAADLALDFSKLKTGVALTIAVWVLMQIGHATIWLTEGESVRLHADWTKRGVTVVLGLLIAQLFGNALFEEIVFRHVFVSQWFERCHFLKWPAARLVVVVVGVQLFFALMHIPHRLAHGATTGELPDHVVNLTVGGLWYAWMYLQTRNLFFAVGVHALSNTPTLVFAQGISPMRMLWWTVTAGLVVHLVVLGVRAWRRARRERSLL